MWSDFPSKGGPLCQPPSRSLADCMASLPRSICKLHFDMARPQGRKVGLSDPIVACGCLKNTTDHYSRYIPKCGQKPKILSVPKDNKDCKPKICWPHWLCYISRVCIPLAPDLRLSCFRKRFRKASLKISQWTAAGRWECENLKRTAIESSSSVFPSFQWPWLRNQ